MLRFFFDEHMAEASGEQLKRRGIDVLTAKDAGRANQKIADVDQLAFAAEQERVMVTADREFIVHASARVPHFGVILLQRADTIGQYVEYLETMALVMDANELHNQLIFYDW